jgi:hypothetical protein
LPQVFSNITVRRATLHLAHQLLRSDWHRHICLNLNN